MNSNLSFILTFTVNKQEIALTIDSSLYTDDDIREAILEKMEGSELEEDFELIVSDWSDTPENMQDLSILAECLEDTEYCSEDVISAGIECGVSIDNIDEAYSGSFGSDEDFAEDMAEQLGCIDKNLSWPYTCIDWDAAAGQLMMDYSEHNGHYFRVM
jgi:antirestriction protein